MATRRIRSDSDDEEGPSTKHIKLTNDDVEMSGDNSHDSTDDNDDAQGSNASPSEPAPEMRNLELKPLEVDTDG